MKHTKTIMKHTKTIMASILALTFASGCKVQSTLEFNLGDAMEDVPIHTNASVYLETPSCGDPRDSRKESNSLVNIKAAVKDHLPLAKYEECFSRGFDTYAHFKLPAVIGSKDMVKHKSYFAVYGLNYSIAPEVKGALSAIQEEILVDPELVMKLTITQDGDQVDRFTTCGYFTNGYNFVCSDFGFKKKGDKATLISSDLLAAELLATSTIHWATDMIIPEETVITKETK